MTQSNDRLPRRAAAALGIVTIAAFGSWFYGYGVLLEPIRQETGWSETLLSAVYGISLLGSGVLATVAGKLLNTHGSRRIYAAGAAVVLGSHLSLAASGGAMWFAVSGVIAGSMTGALGYYAAVHTVIAQLVTTDRRAAAITTNTLWGAFASPIFLPLVAWTVLELGWRPAIRLNGIAVAVSLIAVAIVVPDSRGREQKTTQRLRDSLVAVGRDPAVLAVLATTFAGGIATSVIILYQVPVMVTAGLTLAMASGLAGARGFLQLAGRIPMPWLIGRLGSRNTLRAAHALTGVSCLLLPFAGNLGLATTFAIVAGVGIGALVPVESIFTADVVGSTNIGMVLGLASLARGVGFAVGPLLGGLLAASVGGRTLPLIAASVVAAVAAMVVPRPRDG